MDSATPEVELPLEELRQPAPLRRNTRFQALWIGAVAGQLGGQAASVGYPLIILATTGSAARAGLFASVLLLAMVVCAIPAGTVVDRFDRRRILLVAEGTRALTAVSVTVALARHDLTMTHLGLAAIVLGTASALATPARMLLIRTVVPGAQLTAALTQEEVRDNAASLAGPSLGGVLYGVRTSLPFAAAAVGYLLAWVTVLFVRVPAAPTRTMPETEASKLGWAASMVVGIRALVRDPVLRAVTLAVAALNTAGAPMVIIVTVSLRRQHIGPAVIGVVISGVAIGGLVGTLLVGPLHRWFRPGMLMLVVVLSQVPVFVALAFPLGPWLTMAVLICATLGVPGLSVLIDILVFRKVPDEQRGRVISAAMLLFGIGGPVGAAGAGFLLQCLGVSATVLLIAGMLVIAGGYAASRRQLRQAPWPA